MAMTQEARVEHLRRIGSLGGRATASKPGHMSTIGKRGFRKALDLGYGEWLAGKLGSGYQAKFGRALVLGPQAIEKSRIRAEARRLYAGRPCERCGAKGQAHHLHGTQAGNGPENIAIYCASCHVEEHRSIRRAHKAGR